jgi:hypothetical protein
MSQICVAEAQKVAARRGPCRIPVQSYSYLLPVTPIGLKAKDVYVSLTVAR